MQYKISPNRPKLSIDQGEGIKGPYADHILIPQAGFEIRRVLASNTLKSKWGLLTFLS